MNVLFAIAEAFPFVKMGGLGDIGGSLPGALNRSETRVRVILPKYGSIPDCYLSQMKQAISFKVKLGWRRISCTIEVLELEGIHYYFVDNDYYFQRDRVYGYEDDGERFAFFCKAVLESLIHLDFQPDIIHCHDWHTALIPLLLRENYGHNPYYFEIKTILTVHNLKHQGQVPIDYFEDVLGLGGHTEAWEKLEYYGQLNFLKAGLLSADKITTVSPTYAWEIQNAYYGENLDSILRQRSTYLYGILNGIDTVKYNPEKDSLLFADLSSMENKRDISLMKTENKIRLQEMLHLPVRKDIPLIGMVSRLVAQKGLDLVAHILEEILNMDLQIVVLGKGEKKYEELFTSFAEQYSHKLAARMYFNEELAHQIYGGADILLMPSQFEPCGLSQMIAMRYGTIPVVRETGGLKDTVSPYNEFTGEGNGFGFENYNAHELLFTIQKAVKIYYEQKDTWFNLVNNALKSDFSWEKSAQEYLALYRSIQE